MPKVNCQFGRQPLLSRKGWKPCWEENLGSLSFKSENYLEPRFERYVGIWRHEKTFGGLPRAPGMLVQCITAQPGLYNRTLSTGWNICMLYKAHRQINCLGGTLYHTTLLIGFPGTQLGVLYCHFESLWWLPWHHMGPTWECISQAHPLSLAHGKASCFTGRDVWVRRRMDWYCGYTATNDTVLDWCDCAAHVILGQSFDLNAWVSLYGHSEMGSESVTPPTQTSLSPRPALLTPMTRNTQHPKSRTVIQIFYSLVEDLVANYWEPYPLSLSLTQPTCVKMKALIGRFALKWR